MAAPYNQISAVNLTTHEVAHVAYEKKLNKRTIFSND